MYFNLKEKKQKHQQVSKGIPGGASGKRIKTNEMKTAINVAGKNERKGKKGKMIQMEQLGYDCKLTWPLKKRNCKTNCTKYIIITSCIMAIDN